MSNEINNEAVSVSKSKAKRDARKAEVKAEKNKKNFDKILGWVIGIVIAAVVVGAIVMGIIQSLNATTSSSDFSAGLSADGYVAGANLNKVKDLGVESLVIPASEVAFTDENVDTQIESLLTSAQYYSDDASLVTKSGDTINLDYVGSVDGVEFEGGNTNGAGTTLTLGSNTYIDDFETQLEGAHPGDAVTVTVTFPDPYENNPDLAGKEAVFECTVNSIQVTPELTDDFVKENFSEYVSTVAELREYIQKNGYESNVKSYISDYITNNADAKAPSSYLKHLRSVIKYNEEQTYEYYNSYYYYYLGSYLYSSFQDYTGKTDAEYEDYLKETAKSQAAVDLTYESLFKKHNLTVSEENYNYVLESYGGDNAVTTYGQAYLNQVAMKYTVLEYLASAVTVQ